MFKTQIKNLISNIEKPKEPLQLDVIFEGGAFKGLYELGVSYFLKELEKRNYIKINRISGTSIGSIIGMCYVLDILDDFYTLYSNMRKHGYKNLNILLFRDQIIDITKDITEEKIKKLNDSLFITYNDIISKKQQVVSKYNTKDKLIQTILNSCHIPYITSDTLCEEEFFIDGGMPFIFNDRENEKINQNKDMLYVNVSYLDLLNDSLNVYKETSQDGRILNGILKCYSLFLNRKNNNICSFISKWKIQEYATLRIKQILILVLVYFVYFSRYFLNTIHSLLSNYLLYNRIVSILKAFTDDILIKCFR